jgi:hypothetical protein
MACLQQALAFEREDGLVKVVVDGPQVGNSVPAVWEVTSPKLAVVRMDAAAVPRPAMKRIARTMLRRGSTPCDLEHEE